MIMFVAIELVLFFENREVDLKAYAFILIW